MKKFKKICASVLAITICGIFGTLKISAADVSAYSAILIEASSGEVIFEKNSEKRLPMASTTKIMTAIVALEEAADRLDVPVTVSPKACGVEGSSIYLKAGEKLTLNELLYAVMLQSANDAAAAVAYEIAGDISAFADLMNQKAAELGLKNTHFTNPHGLDDENHYTTAEDLAAITRYAMSNAKFRELVSAKRYEIPSNSSDEALGSTRILVNHNKLLRMSDSVIGVKTGFTKRSGRCLVSAAKSGEVELIAVTLNAPDDWNDHLALHELGFASYHSEILADEGELIVQIPATSSARGYITAQSRDRLELSVKNGTEITSVTECPRIILNEVALGDEVGRVKFYAEEKLLGEVKLYSTESTLTEEAEKKRLGEKILDFFK